MRALVATLLLAAALAACGASTTAAKVTGIEPGQGPEGQVVDVVITGEGFLAAVLTDFARAGGSSVDGAVTAALVNEAGDALPLDEVVLEDARTVRARVPGSVPRGLYDVRVVDARGAEATLPGAFTVVTPAESVTAFTLEPIGPQRVGVPFAVQALAVDQAGQLVESFEGAAALSDDSGAATPATSPPFVRGRLLVFVTVGALAAGNVLRLSDPLGHTGASDPFDVAAGPPARLELVAAPASAAAGACVGPFRLALEDQFGFAVTASADEAIALEASPSGALSFFADATCATAASAVTLATGSGALEFWATATTAGPVTARAVPASFPSVEQAVQVAPQAPVTLTFSAPPTAPRAGQCSPPIDLTAEDVLGNAAPPAAPLALTFTVTPAPLASLFSDAACSTPLGSLVLDPSRASARVWLLAVDAGVVQVGALAGDGDGGTPLGSAAVDLEVQP